MATRVGARIDEATGEQVIVREEISDTIQAQIADVEMSAARRRFLQSSHQKPSVELVDFGTEKYWVRSLTPPQVTRCHLMSSRSGDGNLQTAPNDDDLRVFYISVLESCVIDEKGNPFFTLQEAADWVDSGDLELHAIADVLFSKAISMEGNALLLKKVDRAMIPHRANALPASETEPTASTSMTSTTSLPKPPNGEAGSPTIPSNTTPVALPSDAESTNNTDAANPMPSEL